MICLGMVGMNPGNGHPYSFSAILNGYEPKAMACSPYPNIARYLGAEPPEAFGIDDARVTHIWAADPTAARQVAKACRIPNVVDDFEEMIGEIDGVILPIDDPTVHLQLAKPFLKAGIPAFIDKPLAVTMSEAEEMIRLGGGKRLMSCSALRYSNEIAQLRDDLPSIGSVVTAHAISWRSWIRYGLHLLEPLLAVIGRNVIEVRNVGRGDDSIVVLRYDDGRQLVLQVSAEIGSVIQLSLYGERGHRTCTFSAWFAMFKNTLARFVSMIKNGEPAIAPEEMLDLLAILLAGQQSLAESGRPIRIEDLRPLSVR